MDLCNRLESSGTNNGDMGIPLPTPGVSLSSLVWRRQKERWREVTCCCILTLASVRQPCDESKKDRTLF